MARTTTQTTDAVKLLARHHHKHHHKPKVPAQAEFHIGNFHHHITGAQLGDGLIVIVILIIVACVLAGVRWLLF